MTIRTWTEIDLQQLNANIGALMAFTKVKLLLIVKANAYGHGVLEVAKAAILAGAEFVGVGDPEEALLLRKLGFDGPILVLGHTSRSDLQALIGENIHFSFWTKEQADAASETAIHLRKQVHLHLYVDLEMGRFGCFPELAVEIMEYAAELPLLTIEGLMSHLPSIEEDPQLTFGQIDRFRALTCAIKARHPRLLAHLSSSAGIPLCSTGRFDMVRAGIVAYGVSAAAQLIPGVRPVLTWKAAVLDVRSFPAGSPIGYGGEYVCSAQETVAVIGVGYADGFRRTPKNINTVTWNGQLLPVVGRVCTQHCFVKIPAGQIIMEGDEVILIGEDQGLSITAKDLAERWGTNEWDVLTAIGASVKRLYVPAQALSERKESKTLNSLEANLVTRAERVYEGDSNA